MNPIAVHLVDGPSRQSASVRCVPRRRPIVILGRHDRESSPNQSAQKRADPAGHENLGVGVLGVCLGVYAPSPPSSPAVISPQLPTSVTLALFLAGARLNPEAEYAGFAAMTWGFRHIDFPPAARSEHPPHPSLNYPGESVPKAGLGSSSNVAAGAVRGDVLGGVLGYDCRRALIIRVPDNARPHAGRDVARRQRCAGRRRHPAHAIGPAPVDRRAGWGQGLGAMAD